MENGTIGFIPTDAKRGHQGPASTDARKSAGADIVAGAYEILSAAGPAEGSYEVVIYAERPGRRKIEADEGSGEMIDQMFQFIPAIYNARTTLTVDISADRDDLDFQLEKPLPSKGRRR